MSAVMSVPSNGFAWQRVLVIECALLGMCQAPGKPVRFFNDDIERTSLDPYATIRTIFLQKQRAADLRAAGRRESPDPPQFYKTRK